MKPRADIIVGGFPCQDLSVAGKRAGLKGERSGLFHEFIRIVRELRPALAIIENVPGLVSSNSGHDFRVVLDSLAECGALDICWRTLDSRYFDLAQRRERVFLVADFRGQRASQILIESPCGCRNPPSGQEARSRVASTIRSRSHSTGVNPPGRGGEDDQNLVFTELGEGHQTYQETDVGAPVRCPGGGGGTVNNLVVGALNGNDGGADDNDAQCGRLVYQETGQEFWRPGLPSCSSHDGKEAQNLVVGSLQSHSERHGHAMTTQQAAEAGHLVLFVADDFAAGGFSQSDQSRPVTGNRDRSRGAPIVLSGACTCPKACDCQDEPNGFCSNKCPEHNDNPEPSRDCPVHWREALIVTVLDTKTGTTAVDNRWDWHWWTQGNGSCDCNRQRLFAGRYQDTGYCIGCKRYLVVEVNGRPPDPDFNASYPRPLVERFLPTVAHALSSEGAGASEDGTGRGTPLVCFNPHRTLQKDGSVSEGFKPDVVTDALHGPTGNKEPLIAYRVHGENSTAMTGNGKARVADQADVARSLDSCGGYSTDQGGNVVAFQCHGNNVGPMGTLRGGNGGLTGGVPAVAFHERRRDGGRQADTQDDLAFCLESSTHAKGGGRHQNVAAAMGVRRLMPVECLRLQGFPDSWLDLQLADSTKYRMIGNAVSVPVAEWIARRILAAYPKLKTYLSLFSGIGGFDLGFDRAGFRCVGQVEADKHCLRLLAARWPDVLRHDDVRTFPRKRGR